MPKVLRWGGFEFGVSPSDIEEFRAREAGLGAQITREHGYDPDIYLPSRATSSDLRLLQLQLERKDSEFARVSATLDRLEKHRERVQSEFRDPVSSKYKYIDPYLEQLESFADRLIRENIAKQAEPDIVARNIRRTNNALLKALAFEGAWPRRSQPASASKRFATAYVRSKRVDSFPRTVFGTEAWIGRRFAHAMHLNPKFVTRLIALPCVERRSRREVMFANGKAGRGYRVPHRKGKFTDIWC